MILSPYPCLWYADKAFEAAEWVLSVFGDGAMEERSPFAVRYRVRGSTLMHLQGGNASPHSQAASLFVYAGSVSEAQRLYETLGEGGKVVFPLGRQEWSECYGWVMDRYGVNWQIDAADIEEAQKIVPTLLFVNHRRTWVADAVSHYTGLSAGSALLESAPHHPDAGMPDGSLLFARFRMGDNLVQAMSSEAVHDFDLSPALSLVLPCASQAEIDRAWAYLGEDGEELACGWLVDRYGVSWQIVPAELGTWMSDTRCRDQVATELFRMKKIDLDKLKNIADAIQ